MAETLDHEEGGSPLMDRDELVRRYAQGERSFHGVNLAGADLRSVVLDGADLRNADLEGANLGHARFIGASLMMANLSRCDLSGATFQGADLTGAILQDAHAPAALRPAFVDTKMDHVRMHGASLPDVYFERASMQSAQLEKVNFPNARFHDSKLGEAGLSGSKFELSSFEGCDLTAAALDECDLRGVRFKAAVLDRVSLLRVTVNSRTVFPDLRSAEGCSIERFTLESLERYGELTAGVRMQMHIRDDVARLRSGYSGIWQWVHLTALFLFIAPYAWFVGRQFVGARFDCPGDRCVSLGEALIRYVLTGGEFGSRAVGWPFYAVLFGFLYNVVRAILFGKTKVLELEQESSGLPARFSLQGGWLTLWWIARVGFLINLLVVLVHTWHYLQVQVPAP